MTSTDDEKRYKELKEYAGVLKFKLEEDQNAYYEAQSKFRNTQIQYDKVVIELNWLREKLARSGSV